SNIISEGTANTDSDKQALRFAQQDTWPDKTLLKAHLLTEGGYYEQALGILHTVGTEQLKSMPSALEYYFRLARVHDELNRNSEAIEYYNKTIKIGKSSQEQFA